jgi:hypothetical protein
MLSGLGAGLVLLATAAGVPTTAGGLAAGAVLTGCGIAALGWAVLGLRAGRPPAPRAALGSAVGVMGISGALVVSGTAAMLRSPVLPLLAAEVFVFAVAVGAAAELRRRRRRGLGPDRGRGRDEAVPARTSVLGLAVGATLVAALATPALAATSAGELAVPHGELHDAGHAHH